MATLVIAGDVEWYGFFHLLLLWHKLVIILQCRRRNGRRIEKID